MVDATYLTLYTDAELEAEIQRWKAALAAVASGKSYEIKDRSLDRADLADIRDTLNALAREKQRRSGDARPRLVQAVPYRGGRP